MYDHHPTTEHSPYRHPVRPPSPNALTPVTLHEVAGSTSLTSC